MYISCSKPSSHDDLRSHILFTQVSIRNSSEKWLRCTYPLQLFVRQADAVLHPHFIIDTTFLTQDGNGLHSDAVLDNAGGVLLHGDGGTFDTSPRSNTAIPAHNRVQNQGIVLDLSVLQNDRLLNTGTTADIGTSSNGDIGAKLGGRVDVSRRVDVNGWDNVGRRRGKLVGTILPGLLQVQRIGRDSGASSLDLSPKVLGLVDEELFAVGHVAKNILLEADNLVLGLIILVVILVENVRALEILGARVAGETWTVSATLNGALDRGEDDVGAEQVDTTVDQVGDVTLGLLDVMQDALRVVVANNASEVCSGVVGDLGTQNDGLGVLLVEELEHLIQGEGAAHVGVEDEQALGLALENGIAEMVETTGGTKGLVFSQVLDGKVGVGNGGILDEVAEDGLVIVAD